MKKLLVPYKHFVIDGVSKSMLNLMFRYLEIKSFFLILLIDFHFIEIIQIFVRLDLNLLLEK